MCKHFRFGRDLQSVSVLCPLIYFGIVANLFSFFPLISEKKSWGSPTNPKLKEIGRCFKCVSALINLVVSYPSFTNYKNKKQLIWRKPVIFLSVQLCRKLCLNPEKRSISPVFPCRVFFPRWRNISPTKIIPKLTLPGRLAWFGMFDWGCDCAWQAFSFLGGDDDVA